MAPEQFELVSTPTRMSFSGGQDESVIGSLVSEGERTVPNSGSPFASEETPRAARHLSKDYHSDVQELNSNLAGSFAGSFTSGAAAVLQLGDVIPSPSSEPGPSTHYRIKPLPPIPPYGLSPPVTTWNAPIVSLGETAVEAIKHRPPPLQIPNPSTLGMPLFSSYPVSGANVTGTRRRSSAAAQPPSSYKGKERAIFPTSEHAINDNSALSETHFADDLFTRRSDGRRKSYHGMEGFGSGSFRRGSLTRSSAGNNGPPPAQSAHFAPHHHLPSLSQAHPYTDPSWSISEDEATSTHPSRRRRAMTLEQDSPIKQRNGSLDARRRSVDQARHIVVTGDVHIAPGWLPPGALPAVNPADSAAFELTAESQYDALGGIDLDRIASPVRVIRVPSRSESVIQVAELPSGNTDPFARRESTHSNHPLQPYTWRNPSDSMFTLQSVSTIAAGVPLVSPAPSQRGSSAVGGDFFSSKVLLPAGSLGLTDEIVGHAHDSVPPLDIDLSALKIDTSGSPRGNETGGVISSPSQLSPGLEQSGFVDQRMSMPSMTETSSGAGTAEVLLSSASTSLSRSTKNGKDGKDREKEHTPGDIQVVHDDSFGISQQLSWALENRMETKKKRVDKRKYILVELVETEMAYSDHLRDLVHIYLPQLAALSIVTLAQHAAIARNLKEMLYFHEQLSNRMVDVLKEEGLGTNTITIPGMDEGVRVERIARKIAAVFVEDASGFDMYDKYCSGAAAAMNIIRNVQHRPEWTAFEKRCRIVIATRSNTTLEQVLAEDNPNFQPSLMPPPTVSTMPSRLMLRDLLILPVQRICRYPLVLSALLSSATPPSPLREGFFSFHSELDVGVDVDRAMAVMQNSASRANVANQRSTILARTATIAGRLDYHPIVTRNLLSNLGPCVLSGALDALYHHPTAAPLQSTVKVRYMGAFLYYGFLILAKIKKADHYEIKHYLPLQMFEMVDVTEGFLPHSIRLTLRDHHMELAAACAEEKDVWAAAMCEARDNATISPFDLPCSIGYGVGRSRRESAYLPGEFAPVSATSPKRYSMTAADFSLHAGAAYTSEPLDDYGREVLESPRSPTMPASPMRREGIPLQTPSRILMRRASPLYRVSIDSNLQDIFSDECNIARASGKQLGSQSFGIIPSPASASAPGTLRNRLSMKDSSVLRRRRSYVDVHSSPSTETLTSSHSTVTGTFGRTVSGYGNNMASSFKRGFSISSQDGNRSKKRLSAGSVEMLCHTATEVNTAATERPISLADAWPSPPPRNRRTISDDGLKMATIQTAQPKIPGSSEPGNRARSQKDIARRRSMQNLTSILKPKHSRANSVPVSPILDVSGLSGSETDHDAAKIGAPDSVTSGATTPSHVGDYTTNPIDVDVYALGAGLTNALRAPASKAGLLSRTMSFKRSTSGFFSGDMVFPGSRRSSIDQSKAIIMNTLATSPTDVKPSLPSVPGSPTGSSRKVPAPFSTSNPNSGEAIYASTSTPISSLSSSPEDRTSSSSVKYPASTTSDSASTNTSDFEDASHNGASSQAVAPKRRRSVRFFHRLNQFTSLSGSNSNADK